MDLTKNAELVDLLSNDNNITGIEIIQIDRDAHIISLIVEVNGQRFEGDILEAFDEMIIMVKEAAREGEAFPELYDCIIDYVLDR